MEEKRSAGVTILGWLFIIGGVFGLLGNINAKNYFQIMGTGLLAYLTFFLSIAIAFGNIVGGMFILKLKSWARKLAIILCLVNIVLVLFNFKLVPASLSKVEETYKKDQQLIYEKYKPEYQQQALEQLRKTKELTDKATQMVMPIMTAIAVVWNIFIIYFFTRPKVQEQFE